ncbi:MAG: AAA family ATPase [Phycisphaerae bacterium]|jgi:pilus assembly protein CpaE
MASLLRVYLFDRSNGNETSLRPAFEQTPGTVIVGSASSFDELREWLRHGQLDVVAVNLDNQPEQDLQVVQRVTEIAPSCGVVGVSARQDPASIIAAMRAGCSQFVCAPIDPKDLDQALGRIRAARMATPSASKRVCVIGAAGGSGATSIACNLAMELAHISDRRCALVDLNLEFGDVACAFDCTPRFSLADVCQDGVEVDRVLLGKALHELPCNVSILARPEQLEDAGKVTPEGVQEMLRVLSEMLPFVVIDLPRSFNVLNAAAVRNADKVLIITQLGVPFIRNASRIYENLRLMETPEDAIEIVLNRCKSVYERIGPDDVESHFGKPVFAMIPNDYRRVQTALDLGHPIVADAPNTPARLAIQQMARRIAGVEGASEHQARPVKAGTGLFARFWK